MYLLLLQSRVRSRMMYSTSSQLVGYNRSTLVLLASTQYCSSSSSSMHIMHNIICTYTTLDQEYTSRNILILLGVRARIWIQCSMHSMHIHTPRLVCILARRVLCMHSMHTSRVHCAYYTHVCVCVSMDNILSIHSIIILTLVLDYEYAYYAQYQLVLQSRVCILWQYPYSLEYAYSLLEYQSTTTRVVHGVRSRSKLFIKYNQPFKNKEIHSTSQSMHTTTSLQSSTSRVATLVLASILKILNYRSLQRGQGS